MREEPQRPFWLLNAGAVGFAFGTYFCMYAFRKPFAAATFEGAGFLGLDLKTVYVIAQILGYTASKYIGIRVVTELSRAGRLPLLLGLIAAAEIALVLFAVVPTPYKVAALFLNGLPLGMVWGLVVRYLEGRRSSEFLLAGLSCSFIVASGVVKDVGRWLMTDWGVSEYWMPSAAGAIFLPLFVACALMLNRTPEPAVADVAERTERAPMTGEARRAFFRRFWPGLVLLMLVYLILTAFRDFRDNYGVELFQELGLGDQRGLFTQTETLVAVGVLALMAALGWVKQHRRGLVVLFGIMTFGVLLLGLATLGLKWGLFRGDVWMVLVGLGVYLSYVPFGSFLFDRIMAATRFTGTAVFAINLADAVGYSGSVAMQLYKDMFAREASRLEFFILLNYVLSVVGAVALLGAGGYFLREARRSGTAVTG
jgi:hypothetical protein